MTLTDTELRDALANDLTIAPLDDEQIQPASVDLRLGEEFVVHDSARPDEIDTRADEVQAGYTKTTVPEAGIKIHPDTVVLGTTQEVVSLPDDIAGTVKGRSSFGRLGLIVHTAGFVDPGFEGHITLEFVNHNPRPIRVYPGQRVCQLVLERCEAPAETAYGEKSDAKYQGQSGATKSRIAEDSD